MKKKKNIGINILIASLAISGLVSITTGAVLNKKVKITKNNKVEVEIIQKQVAKIKSNIPKLKEITLEINEPLSVNTTDYIENIDDIEESILNKFKLDTSLVNVTQAGKYTYTINYKDKTYNGTVTVKEKQLPIIENITLKELSIELGKELPKTTEISEYITTNIPDELKENIIINVQKVNINIAGNYQYTVTYANKIYTGNITIYQPQSTEIKDKDKTDITTDTKDNETQEEIQTTEPPTTETTMQEQNTQLN